MENWLSIAGYEGVYEVSDEGRVRRIGTWIDNWGTVRQPRGVVTPKKTGPGYAGVDLSKDKTKRRHYIHRLVAQAFMGGIPDGMEPNHKDGNKFNNSVDNLEFLTHAENCKHAHANLLSVTRSPDGTFKKFIHK